VLVALFGRSDWFGRDAQTTARRSNSCSGRSS
jgi:hypothetical protein